MSSASSTETDSGATAVLRLSSRVSRLITVLFDPDGRTTTSSPTLSVPAEIRPVYRRRFCGSGRENHFTVTRSSSMWVAGAWGRAEDHTSELQSQLRSSYVVFCL